MHVFFCSLCFILLSLLQYWWNKEACIEIVYEWAYSLKLSLIHGCPAFGPQYCTEWEVVFYCCKMSAAFIVTLKICLTPTRFVFCNVLNCYVSLLGQLEMLMTAERLYCQWLDLNVSWNVRFLWHCRTVMLSTSWCMLVYFSCIIVTVWQRNTNFARDHQE